MGAGHSLQGILLQVFCKFLIKGVVTVIDLGATACIPCKMMAPVLEKVREDYKGKASVVFIDVWKTPEVGKEFGIRSIPTQ